MMGNSNESFSEIHKHTLSKWHLSFQQSNIDSTKCNTAWTLDFPFVKPDWKGDKKNVYLETMCPANNFTNTLLR